MREADSPVPPGLPETRPFLECHGKQEGAGAAHSEAGLVAAAALSPTTAAPLRSAHTSCDDYGAPAVVMDKRLVQRLCRERGDFVTPECITTLHLQGMRFRRLAGLEEYVSVRVLHLESNCLEDLDGMRHMAALRVLYLKSNGLTSLDNALVNCVVMDALSVDANPLGDAGLLSSHLPPSLSTLHASSIGLRGAPALQWLAQQCPNLAVLDLSRNNLSGRDTLEALAGMKSLRVLYCQNNPVIQETDYRRTLVSRLPHLSYLDDLPVDDLERKGSEAWAVGGSLAEQAARLAWRDEKRRSQRRTTSAFAVERARRRLAREIIMAGDDPHLLLSHLELLNDATDDALSRLLHWGRPIVTVPPEVVDQFALEPPLASPDADEMDMGSQPTSPQPPDTAPCALSQSPHSASATAAHASSPCGGGGSAAPAAFPTALASGWRFSDGSGGGGPAACVSGEAGPGGAAARSPCGRHEHSLDTPDPCLPATARDMPATAAAPCGRPEPGGEEPGSGGTADVRDAAAADASSATRLECSVCSEGLTIGGAERLSQLPCGHRFHDRCIRQWLVNFSATCPICRALVAPTAPPPSPAAATPPVPASSATAVLQLTYESLSGGHPCPTLSPTSHSSPLPTPSAAPAALAMLSPTSPACPASGASSPAWEPDRLHGVNVGGGGGGASAAAAAGSSTPARASWSGDAASSPQADQTFGLPSARVATPRSSGDGAARTPPSVSRQSWRRSVIEDGGGGVGGLLREEDEPAAQPPPAPQHDATYEMIQHMFRRSAGASRQDTHHQLHQWRAMKARRAAAAAAAAEAAAAADAIGHAPPAAASEPGPETLEPPSSAPTRSSAARPLKDPTETHTSPATQPSAASPTPASTYQSSALPRQAGGATTGTAAAAAAAVTARARAITAAFAAATTTKAGTWQGGSDWAAPPPPLPQQRVPPAPSAVTAQRPLSLAQVTPPFAGGSSSSSSSSAAAHVPPPPPATTAASAEEPSPPVCPPPSAPNFLRGATMRLSEDGAAGSLVLDEEDEGQWDLPADVHIASVPYL